MKTIFKIKKKKQGFTCITNSTLADPSLSWKAKGLLAFLMSKPEDWQVHPEEICQFATDGETSTRSALAELIDAGYARKFSERDDKGRFIAHVWEIYEDKRENPEVSCPDLENPEVGNPTLLNKDNTNKRSNKKKNNSRIIKSIFSYWNTKNVVIHRKLSGKIKRKIESALKEFAPDEIKKAIDNYATVLHGRQYYWTYRWTLDEFLQRGLVKFLDVPLENFLARRKPEEIWCEVEGEGLTKDEFYRLKKEGKIFYDEVQQMYRFKQ